MGEFTDQLWNAIGSDIMPAIYAHPFIKGLTEGTLPEASFRQYVEQDSAYLEAFGRGLAIIASRADEGKDFMMFCEHARNTMIVEEALHREFMQHWKTSAQSRIHWTAMAPEPLLYASYLLRVASERPYFESLAAFLPCYWIYHRVGHHLSAEGSPHPLYQKWIDTYSGEVFGAVVAEMLDCVERVSKPLSASQKDVMSRHFRRTSQLEYLFWDSAWRGSAWPFAEQFLPS